MPYLSLRFFRVRQRRSLQFALVILLLGLGGCDTVIASSRFATKWYGQCWASNTHDYLPLWAANNDTADSRKLFRRANANLRSNSRSVASARSRGRTSSSASIMSRAARRSR